MAPSTRPQERPAGIRRIERAIGYAAVTVVGFGLVCFLIVLISALAFNVKDRTTGVWPTITNIPILAFPIGVLLIIVYVILSVVRRSRENSETSR